MATGIADNHAVGIPFTVNTSGDGNLPFRSADHRPPVQHGDVRCPAQYTYGNAGRNILFGPSLRNLGLWRGTELSLRRSQAPKSPDPNENKTIRTAVMSLFGPTMLM
jgi:hypothetical protein